jgi:Tol biopolymer transport system component
MNDDGSGQRRLSQNYGGRPVWSPDGRYILFHAGDLYVMRVDGFRATRLPISGLGELAFPDWTK